jgi:hypothetical protein
MKWRRPRASASSFVTVEQSLPRLLEHLERRLYPGTLGCVGQSPIDHSRQHLSWMPAGVNGDLRNGLEMGKQRFEGFPVTVIVDHEMWWRRIYDEHRNLNISVPENVPATGTYASRRVALANPLSSPSSLTSFIARQCKAARHESRMMGSSAEGQYAYVPCHRRLE